MTYTKPSCQSKNYMNARAQGFPAELGPDLLTALTISEQTRSRYLFISFYTPEG